MDLQHVYLLALGGLVLLFGTGTALGLWLQARAVGPAQAAQIRQLNARIRSGWSIVLLFAVAFALGRIGLVLVFALASFLALREFIALTPIRASDYWALVVAFYVAIPVQYVLIAGGLYAWYAVFIPVYLFLVLPVIMALKQDVEQYLQRISKVQWGLMISVYCVSHAPAIATLRIPGHEDRGALLLLFFLLIVQLSDLLAVMASATFGRTPLRSNPSKSREGVVLGGIAATGVGALLWWITPFTWWQAALMAAATVVAGFLGGLVLDSVKRSLGVRTDATHLTDADGQPISRGVLDRIDALSFAAPVFFHLTLYFFVP
jgi:phosphatidate cytidylyltransferase